MSWLIDQIITDNQKGQGSSNVTADTVTTTKTPTTVTRNLPTKTSTQTRDGSTVIASKEDAQTTVATVTEDACFNISFKIKIRGGLGSGATTPLCS